MKSGRVWELDSDKLKIVLVSYLNTYPIVWGLKQLAKRYKPKIILCPPSQCSRSLMEGKTGLALVPAITYLTCDLPFDILPYGIISKQDVDTVLLVGNTPLEEWQTVLLDRDSLTSVELAKILFRLKNLNPKFISGIKGIDRLDDKTGALLIGNKCFQLSSRFSQIYDLSKLWFDLTGFPFVFALFLARAGTDKNTLLYAYRMIKEAIHFGLKNLNQVIEDWLKENPHEVNLKEKAYYYDYLKNKISYTLSPNAIKGLKTFYEKCEKTLPPDKESRLSIDYFRQFDSPFKN
jgi:chorismate dehydratase